MLGAQQAGIASFRDFAPHSKNSETLHRKPGITSPPSISSPSRSRVMWGDFEYTLTVRLDGSTTQTSELPALSHASAFS